MTIQERITALAQAIGEDIKVLKAGSSGGLLPLFGDGPPDARARVVGSAESSGYSIVVPFAVESGDTVIIGYKTEGAVGSAGCVDTLGSGYSKIVDSPSGSNKAALFSAVLPSSTPSLTVTVTNPGADFDKVAVMVVRGLTGSTLAVAGMAVPGEAYLNLLSVDVPTPRSFHVLLWAGYRNVNVVTMHDPFRIYAQGNGSGAIAIGAAMRVSPGEVTATTVTTAGFPDNQALLLAAFEVAPAFFAADEGAVYYDASAEPCLSYVMHQGAWRAVNV